MDKASGRLMGGSIGRRSRSDRPTPAVHESVGERIESGKLGLV